MLPNGLELLVGGGVYILLYGLGLLGGGAP